MRHKLIYWKSAVEDLRYIESEDSPASELVAALAHARKRTSQIEQSLFKEKEDEKARTDRMLERILAAIKRLPDGEGRVP